VKAKEAERTFCSVATVAPFALVAVLMASWALA
jgi:hypothetical protein